MNIITSNPVNVRDLNAGDLVIGAGGCILEVTEEPRQSRGHNQDHGGVWFCKSMIVHTMDVGTDIVSFCGGLGGYWTLQGNDLFLMSRITLDDTSELLH